MPQSRAVTDAPLPMLDVLQAVIDFAPRLLAALVLLMLGWLVARLLRLATSRLIRLAQRFLTRRFAGGLTELPQQWRPRSLEIFPRLIYWLTLLAFLGMASWVLGLELFSRWIDSLVTYAPTLLLAAAIILSGYFLGEIAHDVTIQAARTAHLSHSDLLGRAAQVSLFGSALLIGASQLGIDVSLVVYLVTVALAALLGAFALGFGLATPGHVNNYLSARYLRRYFNEGDRVEIGDHHGTILTIGPHMVVIETEQGELIVPARLFVEQSCLRLAPADDALAGDEGGRGQPEKQDQVPAEEQGKEQGKERGEGPGHHE